KFIDTVGNFITLQHLSNFEYSKRSKPKNSKSQKLKSLRNPEMGNVLKLVDTVLFMFFFLMAMFAPLLDAQYCLPEEYQPKFLIEFSSWCSNELDYYLVVDKPSFYVGLAWMELCVSWPLSIINLLAMIYDKSWFNTTCLIHGVCLTTSMINIRP
ncbi:hypothetical protein KSS87_012093, partial [Heliosperma pusillum]